MADLPVAHGPNVRRLIVRKMSFLMVPADKPLAAALANLCAAGAVGRYAREASEWVAAALAAVKAGPDNPYGGDDEAIAGKILEGIEARKYPQRKAP